MCIYVCVCLEYIVLYIEGEEPKCIFKVKEREREWLSERIRGCSLFFFLLFLMISSIGIRVHSVFSSFCERIEVVCEWTVCKVLVFFFACSSFNNFFYLWRVYVSFYFVIANSCILYIFFAYFCLVLFMMCLWLSTKISAHKIYVRAKIDILLPK